MGHVLRDLPGSLSPQCTCIVVLCPNPGRPRACRGAVDSTPFINDRLKKNAREIVLPCLGRSGGVPSRKER